MAQPKYNKTRHKILVESVKKGNYRATAARQAKIHPTTLLNWLAEGEADSEAGRETEMAKLYDDITQAEAEFEAAMVDIVVQEGAKSQKQWTAAMTILERTRPDRFGRREVHVLEGGDRPIPLVPLANPETRQLSDRLLQQLANPAKELPAGEVIDGECTED